MVSSPGRSKPGEGNFPGDWAKVNALLCLHYLEKGPDTYLSRGQNILRLGMD